jgi:hypothetical protein
MNEALARSILDDGAESILYPSLREATRTWVRVALLSFGGPAGQIAVMHRIIVEEKRYHPRRVMSDVPGSLIKLAAPC